MKNDEGTGHLRAGAGVVPVGPGRRAVDARTGTAAALADNPDARLARQRIAAAQAGLDQANAAFWPRLQFQSSYTGTDNPMLAFGSILNQRAYSPSLDFNDVPGVDDLNVRGLVTVPLYAGGKNKAARRGEGQHRGGPAGE